MSDDPKSRHFISPELRPRQVQPEGRSKIAPGATSTEIADAARRALGDDRAARLGIAPADGHDAEIDAVFAPSSDVSWTMLEDEAVLLDLESGRYFTLNRTASAAWALLDGERSLGEVVERLGERFDAEPETLRRHVEALVEDLSRKGLVTPRSVRPRET